METDSTYTKTGTKIDMSVKNDEWSDDYSFVVGKKKNQSAKATSGTSIVDLPFNFPTSGTYQLFIKLENSTSSVKKLRLFEII